MVDTKEIGRSLVTDRIVKIKKKKYTMIVGLRGNSWTNSRCFLRQIEAIFPLTFKTKTKFNSHNIRRDLKNSRHRGNLIMELICRLILMRIITNDEIY